MKSLIFSLAIAIDRLLNVLTGGTFQECLSTRAYRCLPRTRKAIDALFFFQENHCRQSFLWEMRVKQEYVEKYDSLR